MIADPQTPDDQWVALAADPQADPQRLAALVVALSADQARLVRAPAIAVAIYRNPRTPLSAANEVVLACHRAGLAPDGIFACDELARAILGERAGGDPAGADGDFAALLQSGDSEAAGAASGEAEGESAAATENPAGSRDAGPSPPARKRRSATIDFTRLKLYEKIRLATLGNAYCRQNLLRDSNRMVAMAAIRSPQITDGEVAQAAGNRALGEEVIRYIANRKELVKHYPVKVALVGNVKCPLAVALRLLPTLNAEDIKRLAKSKNIPTALSVAARKLAAGRGPQ